MVFHLSIESLCRKLEFTLYTLSSVLNNTASCLPRMRPIVSYADLTPASQDLKDMTANSNAQVVNVLPAPSIAASRGEFEESRELTHEEIWDDSALIEAWNSATEEYEAMNGPDKSWKEVPIHRSPL